MKAIVLCAGRGRRFGAKTKILPKCLIPLDRKGSCLLFRYLDIFRETGIKDVVLVVGHLKNKIISACKTHGHDLNIHFITNSEYTRGSLVSLYTASTELKGQNLIMDADVYFEANALKRLIKTAPQKSVFLLDKKSKSAGEEMMLMAKNKRPEHISKKVIPGLQILGEATGIFKLSAKDAPLLKKILKKFYADGIKDVEYEDAYCSLLKKRTVGTVSIEGFWSEMDFVEDRQKISAHLNSRN